MSLGGDLKFWLTDLKGQAIPWCLEGDTWKSLPTYYKTFNLHCQGPQGEQRMRIPGDFYLSLTGSESVKGQSLSPEEISENPYALSAKRCQELPDNWMEIVLCTLPDFSAQGSETHSWKQCNSLQASQGSRLQLCVWAQAQGEHLQLTPAMTAKVSALWGSLGSQLRKLLATALQPAQVEVSLAGIGYRAEKVQEGSQEILKLFLGYSHPLSLRIPSHCQLTIGREPNPLAGTGENQRISLQGPCWESLMDYAQALRAQRRPDDYKSKGVIIHTPKNLRALKNFRKEGKKKKS